MTVFLPAGAAFLGTAVDLVVGREVAVHRMRTTQSVHGIGDDVKRLSRGNESGSCEGLTSFTLYGLFFPRHRGQPGWNGFSCMLEIALMVRVVDG